MRRHLRFWLVLGAVAALAAAVGGYAATRDAQGTFHACVLNSTGAVRLVDSSLDSQSLRSHCTAQESEVSWNSANPDSTVRHISNFMFDGSTVTTPILGARGEIGRLSLSCNHDANGGTGDITYTSSNTGPLQDRFNFSSAQFPGSPFFRIVNGPVTFHWADTPQDNVWFDALLEGMLGADTQGTVRPTLTAIHGFVQHFAFGGCSFYVHVDTSEVASPETFTH